MGFRCICGSTETIDVGAFTVCELCRRYDNNTNRTRKPEQSAKKITLKERMERSEMLKAALEMLREGRIQQDEYDRTVRELKLI